MDRVIIVSADSHVGLTAPQYVDYVEPQYREAIKTIYWRDSAEFRKVVRLLGHFYTKEDLEVIDERGAIHSGGVAGFFDPTTRLRESQAEGVVAEVLHPAGQIAFSAFADATSSRVSSELRAAGVNAHNRFLAEYCSVARNRLLGVAMTHPWPDMAAAVRTIGWARANGMVAVMAPKFAGAEGEDLPAFFDPFWDPYWAACCDNDIPVHVHAGHGYHQGSFFERVRQIVDDTGNVAPGRELFDNLFAERRPLWNLIWGGVFDRFPRLRVVFAEIRADWIPPTLEHLDRIHDRDRPVLALRPSEYWHRNCAVTPSFMRRSDLDVRHAVGLDRFMFATDYPHYEGTWPNTQDFLRLVLDDVPEHEARMMLGRNAIDFYHLDREALADLAQQHGPDVTSLLGHASDVDDRLVDHFHYRSGYRKTGSYTESIDGPILVRSVEEDARAISGIVRT